MSLMQRVAMREDFVPQTAEDLRMCLSDPMWRLCSGYLYKIMVKGQDGLDGHVLPFRPNRAQRRLIRSLHYRNVILKARQLGFCLDPATRVLTADLRWVRIDSLKPGDEVVSVDEKVPGGRGAARRMRTATVEATQMVNRMAYKIAFADGREVICTAQHPWLARSGEKRQPFWRAIDKSAPNAERQLKVGNQVRSVCSPWDEPSYEDGWFGGIIDGEGSIAKPSSSGVEVNVSQVAGHVWDRIISYANKRGYSARVENDNLERESKHGKRPVPKLCFARMDEVFRLIGQTRPSRMIGRRFWEGKELPGKRNADNKAWNTITSIEPIGEMDLVDLQTSTGTFIAEGMVSHNTTLIAIMWLDHALFVPDQRVGIIAHSLEDAAAIFRDKVKFAYMNLPQPLREAMPLARDSAKEIVFAHNNSAVRVATSMRSGTIHRLHICLSGDTEILLKDGCTKLIRDIEPGDMVMTGSGAYQPATALIKNRIEDIGEPILRLDVHGWHAPLKLTANHQILTREFKTGKPVWKEAGEVERGDYIAFPVREASMKLRDGCLPFGADGRRIPLSRDLGELVGMYLAEGYTRRTETTFTLHRGEEVSRFCALLDEFAGYFSSRRVYDSRESKTTQVVVNGGEFASFLTRFFGGGDNGDKRIPDAVWGYGRKFLDGMIWGYFQGDGCFNNLREVQVTSIRPQLIHQMRMLLTSLRFGVPSVYHRPAGRYYGRDCKETWVLKMHGAANWKFRDHFGLPQDEPATRLGKLRAQMGRNTVERKNWRRGADYYWLRIKSVEIAEDEPFVYDIAMPRSPHNYVTVCGVVHNSEMGKIAAKYPEKAREIVTGSLPAVPINGIAIIESTAEGQEGEFYDIARRAEALDESNRPLNPTEWKFHFFPWWQDEQYSLSPSQAASVSISPTEHEYFDKIEHEMGCVLTLGQRAWYIAKRDNDFSGDAEKMWQEMPSTPDECWQKSTEGTFYAVQLARARTEGRICRIPHIQHVPVNTFWDIGSGDGTGIWLHQLVGPQDRFLRYVEGWGEPYAHYVRILRETGFVFGTHYLPHDAEQERQLAYTIGKPIDMLRQLAPDWTFVTVPRIQTLQHGIELTRTKFQQAWFDEDGCKEGLDHLTLYRKTWNARVGAWTDTPEKHTGHSEAADAFRQWAQGFDHRHVSIGKSAGKARRRSGFTA